MRVLTWLHRWWGVLFCLLFAMWFGSGIVMHFVPFPARSADRYAALSPIDPAAVFHSPGQAIAKAAIAGVLRVALIGRSDGPIYLISGPSAVLALRANDLGDGKIGSERVALADRDRLRKIARLGRITRSHRRTDRIGSMDRFRRVRFRSPAISRGAR